MFTGFSPFGIYPDNGKLLWAWNRTDVSQFGDGNGNPTATNVGTAGTGKLLSSVSTNPDISPNFRRLEYSFVGTTGTTMAFFMINDLPDLPDRYVIYATVGERSANISPAVVLAYQNPNHQFNIRRDATSPSFMQAIAGNGNPGSINVGSAWNLQNVWSEPEAGEVSYYVVEVEEPTSTSDPRLVVWGQEVDSALNSLITFAPSQSTGWTDFGGATQPGNGWDAGWRTGGSMKNVGIMFEKISGNGNVTTMGDIRIYEY